VFLRLTHDLLGGDLFWWYTWGGGNGFGECKWLVVRGGGILRTCWFGRVCDSAARTGHLAVESRALAQREENARVRRRGDVPASAPGFCSSPEWGVDTSPRSHPDPAWCRAGPRRSHPSCPRVSPAATAPGNLSVREW
jgi:hypothetical protein